METIVNIFVQIAATVKCVQRVSMATVAVSGGMEVSTALAVLRGSMEMVAPILVPFAPSMAVLIARRDCPAIALVTPGIPEPSATSV